MTDESLQTLLRTTLPNATVAPTRDLWPEVATRLDRGPRLSPLDVTLAAFIAVALMLLPEGVWLVALHL